MISEANHMNKGRMLEFQMCVSKKLHHNDLINSSVLSFLKLSSIEFQIFAPTNWIFK